MCSFVFELMMRPNQVKRFYDGTVRKRVSAFVCLLVYTIDL
jgi:hypothetical protein